MKARPHSTNFKSVHNRREMNRMKETNEILDLDLLDKLKEHELKELLPTQTKAPSVPGLL